MTCILLLAGRFLLRVRVRCDLHAVVGRHVPVTCRATFVVVRLPARVADVADHTLVRSVAAVFGYAERLAPLIMATSGAGMFVYVSAGG